MKSLYSLAPGLLTAASKLARRATSSLIFLGAGVVMMQASTGTLVAFQNTGPLGTARHAHTSTLLPNGKVLVAGGGNLPAGTFTTTYLTSAELYDPATGMWTPTGSMVTARGHHTATLLPDGKVLVAGGQNNTGPQASAELYDPTTGLWRATGSMSGRRVLFTATLLPNGKVLAAGGYYTMAYASAELYDPTTEIWTGTGNLGAPRGYHTATLLPNGKVLLAGGHRSTTQGVVATAELYDPASGSWTPTGSLAQARMAHTATLLSNGKVLVAGGEGGATTELYDPASGTWTASGNLITARSSHTATLLSNGLVLVVGGSAGFSRNTERYDPATGTWSATESLLAGRYSHTATRLPDGKVLIAGGLGNNNGSLASCELYDPSAPPPSPTPTPTATPTATPTPTPTATPTPAARSLNIATRAQVQTGNNVIIGGFIITGNVAKKIIIRAIGPSLMNSGLSGVLADPVLELRAPNGSLIRANDNWRENSEQALLIQASGIPPQDDLESAIVATLSPGRYTAVLSGKSGGTGLGVVEIYDLEETTDATLANLSTRARVGMGNNVVIGGFILGGPSNNPRIVVRALGPSLTQFGIADALPDPTLELRDKNGGLVAFNDNWDDNPAQASLITATGMQPQDDLEAVIAITLPPGTYTAIAVGKAQGTGVGLVEVYNLQ